MQVPQDDELVMMLVESALERPDTERDEFLQSLCSATPGLLDEVLKRIEWEERMGGFLREPLIIRQEVLSQPFAIGELVNGRFRMVRVVGRGGMGVVYEAVDEKLDRRIAIKCAQTGFQNRLPPEARSAREVSHYNVCKVHELHTASTMAGDVDFITMEFVEGETLSQRVHRTGPLNPTDAKEIALQLCAGLMQAHRQGVVHGDLKCANVILTKSSDASVRAVLTDFGLAKMKLADGGGFGRSERGGTLDYMAPELFLGETMTIASDLYALGIVFHIMLTGQAPERIGNPLMAKRNAVSSRAVTATLAGVRESDWMRQISDLPSPWGSVVGKCLAANPPGRYGSVHEVIAALNPTRRVAMWAAAAVLTVASVAGFAFMQWSHPSGPGVRLAMLPATVQGSAVPAANGILDDVAARLAGARGNFLVISSVETLRNNVDSPQKAKSVLGASHVLRTSLQNNGREITALASIVDIGSGVTLQELKGAYAPQNVSVLAKALTSTVTGAFRLSGVAQTESVNAAAYPDYVQGIDSASHGLSRADAAIASFERAAVLDPKSALPQAWVARVDLLKFTGMMGREWLERAAEATARARSINPDAYLVLYVSGGVNRHKGQYEQAVQDYRRAIELGPNEAEAWRSLATTYTAMNQPSEAIATYKRAIEAKPENFAAYLDFGIFYASLGQFGEAEEQLRKATALAPANLNSYVELGIALKQQGKFAESEASFLTALKLTETPNVLVNLGALYYSQRRFLEASQLFEKSIQAGPPTALRYSNLGDVYTRLGRSRDASEAYRKAMVLAESEVTLNPRRGLSRALLASIAAGLGDANRAQFEMAQALQMDPQNVMLRRNAVLTYELLKDRNKAMSVARDSPKSLIAELNRDPLLSSLQADPQFQELLKK